MPEKLRRALFSMEDLLCYKSVFYTCELRTGAVKCYGKEETKGIWSLYIRKSQ